LILLVSCGKKVTVFSKTHDRENLDIQELKFVYLSMRSKVNLRETHKTTNATAVVRIKKDSLIWFNLTGTLGVQGMRGLITRDSVKIINRVDKEYRAYSISEVAAEFNFPIDFELIQSMIVGNMPKPKEQDDYVKIQSGKFVIRQNIKDILIDNYVDRDIMKLVEVSVLEKATDNSLKLLYKDFREVDNQAFPFSSFISLIHHNEFGELETQLTINHNKVEISDNPLKFPFNIPKKYAQN
jgi:hypothetical protein